MDWLSRRYKQYEKIRDDRKAVIENAEKTYEELWEEIKRVVAAAESLSMQLVPAGEPRHRTVKMGERELNIELSGDRHGITASSSDGRGIRFNIAVCPNGAICLKHEGVQVSYSEATQMIMEPFLFDGESPYIVPRET